MKVVSLFSGLSGASGVFRMKVWGVRCCMFVVCFSWLHLIGQSGFANQSSDEGSFGALPFIFEANKGQSESPAEFVGRGTNYTVQFEAGKTKIVLPPAQLTKGMEVLGAPSIVTMEFVGAS